MSFFLYYILPFLFVLGVLIFFHELGHFLTAKAFGVRVLKFSLGFGPKVAGKKVGETEYLISAVPLGGYVKMLGESDDDETQVRPGEEKASFSHQPVIKRMAIVLAGPLFNLFLALFIFCMYFLVYGNQVMVPEIGQVRPGSPAERAGLQKGDKVVAVGGKAIRTWTEIKGLVQGSRGEAIEVTVDRSGTLVTVAVVPEESVEKNLFGEDVKTAIIGIVSSGEFATVPLGGWEAIREGFGKTWDVIKLTCLTVVKLFQLVIPVKTVGGPILIGQLAGQIAQENLTYLFPFMAVISVNLGILNLLPVPILDGGFIIFLLIELITGKPLSIRKREWAQKVGLFLLITLMAVVLYNDVTRLLE
jgi:regulator of sigma E protease